jgi:hypothetical protein
MQKASLETKQTKNKCARSSSKKIRDSKQNKRKNTCNIGEISNCYIINE